LLYATDRSEHAAPALRYAYELSANLSAKLNVLYAHEIPQIRISVARPLDQIEHHVVKEQKEILKTYCVKHLGETIKDGNMHLEVVHDGSVSHAIIEKSKELSADMILIGRKDRHTDRGLLVGDIGKSLLGKVPCPLLIVPNTIQNFAIDNLLYATAFEEADIEAINKLVPMARVFDAQIHVVHISTEKEYAGEDQMEWFKELLEQKVAYPNIAFKLIFSDRIEKKLKAYFEQVSADIVVLLERGEKGFFKKLFSQSLVKKMESHINTPLLSFRKAYM
jgi:nucleotide-binding universal stress UspA family protein